MLSRRFFAALVSLPLLSAACWVEADPHPRPLVEAPAAPASPQPTVETVATGLQIDTVPGDGAGVFVEYAGGGQWRVFVSCDTNVTGLGCSYDLYFAALGGSVWQIGADPKDVGDSTYRSTGSMAEAHFFTTVEIDGVSMLLDAGAGLQIEAYLDGQRDPRLFYWNDPGVLRQGAPTNPVAFTPTTP
jgi:hypothetical protein